MLLYISMKAIGKSNNQLLDSLKHMETIHFQPYTISNTLRP